VGISVDKGVNGYTENGQLAGVIGQGIRWEGLRDEFEELQSRQVWIPFALSIGLALRTG
jgi:hypothetical protein